MRVELSRAASFDAAWREGGRLRGASFGLTLTAAADAPGGLDAAALARALAAVRAALDHAILDDVMGAPAPSLADVASWIAARADAPGLAAVTLTRLEETATVRL